MTCIVGMADESAGAVMLGADSAGSDGWTIDAYTTPKLVGLRLPDGTLPKGRHDIVIGYTGSYRMGQLLAHRLTLPERGRPASMTPERYLVARFIPAIRKLFKDEGYAKVENAVEQGGNFLVGLEGHLFEVQGDFSVLESTQGVMAVGSGEHIARGALYTVTRHMTGVRPVRALRIALEAAEATVTTVAGPRSYIASGNVPKPREGR
jgi:ATP-dependent protease HslVU (ClpYQ) peptidase subunit